MYHSEVVTPNLYSSDKPQDLVLNQTSADLSIAIESAAYPKKKLRHVSLKTGIHTRTLSRILSRENRPTPLTVYKIYRYLMGNETQEKILQLCPEVIRNYLSTGNKFLLEKNLNFDTIVETEIQSNSIFAEIYMLCGAQPLTHAEIEKKFGEHGLRLIQEMTAKKYLQETTKGTFVIGANQIFLTPACIKSLGVLATKTYGKPENGAEANKHFMGFIVEGLTEDAYREWMAADIEAYKKKIEIAKKASNLGKKRVFTFQITDTLESE